MKQKIYQIEFGLIIVILLLSYFKINNWLLLLSTYLIPDLAALGFLFSPKIGKLIYNSTHSLIGPNLLMIYLILSSLTGNRLLLGLDITWYLHIIVDRLLGWNLFPRKIS